MCREEHRREVPRRAGGTPCRHSGSAPSAPGSPQGQGQGVRGRPARQAAARAGVVRADAQQHGRAWVPARQLGQLARRVRGRQVDAGVGRPAHLRAAASWLQWPPLLSHRASMDQSFSLFSA